jgi:hypothetical protein
MNFFSHSGDIGDIIYSLPTIRAKGGGELVLFDYPGRTYQPMTESRYLSLKPLLDFQRYIFKSRFSTSHEDSSLNGFRHHIRNGENNSDWHLCTNGLDWTHRIEKWLEVPEPIISTKNIMAWTPRHHSFNFPWKAIVDKFGYDLGFIGYKEYYKEFCSLYSIPENKIKYLEANDFMWIAQLVEGCNTFIGNLTSVTAIAEGLKKKVIIEGYHNNAGNNFIRHGSIILYTDRVEL